MIQEWMSSNAPIELSVLAEGTPPFSYQWRRANGTVLATATTLTTTFAKASTIKLTLTVTDNGGLTNASTKTVVVP